MYMYMCIETEKKSSSIEVLTLKKNTCIINWGIDTEKKVSIEVLTLWKKISSMEVLTLLTLKKKSSMEVLTVKKNYHQWRY